jgi:putative redox protein
MKKLSIVGKDYHTEEHVVGYAANSRFRFNPLGQIFNQEESTMIKATSELPSYQTRFTNGQDVSMADTTSEKGGSSAGFRPDELLEAALASSLNMTIRKFAEGHSIPLTSVSTTVKLDGNYPDETIFNYALELTGPLSEDDRRLLTEAARSCPVLQTLSKKLSFQD